MLLGVQAKAFGLKMMHAVSGSYALSEGTIHVSCSVGATILAGHRQTTADLMQVDENGHG